MLTTAGRDACLHASTPACVHVRVCEGEKKVLKDNAAHAGSLYLTEPVEEEAT